MDKTECEIINEDTTKIIWLLIDIIDKFVKQYQQNHDQFTTYNEQRILDEVKSMMVEVQDYDVFVQSLEQSNHLAFINKTDKLITAKEADKIYLDNRIKLIVFLCARALHLADPNKDADRAIFAIHWFGQAQYQIGMFAAEYSENIHNRWQRVKGGIKTTSKKYADKNRTWYNAYATFERKNDKGGDWTGSRMTELVSKIIKESKGNLKDRRTVKGKILDWQQGKNIPEIE